MHFCKTQHYVQRWKYSYEHITRVFLCVFLFYLSLFSWFPPSAPVSFHTIPIKQSEIAIERDVEEESVIFKHGEESVSGTDSVRVAQKWRKFKSHAEILREEGAYVTVAFQYSCPKCWLKESQFHLMFFRDKKIDILLKRWANFHSISV